MEKTPHLIKVINLPGIRQLEDAILLYDVNSTVVSEKLNIASKATFEITPADLCFQLPANFEKLSATEQEKIDELYDKYENRFETSDDLTDDENVEIMRESGFDFLDERGQPLLCTKLLSRVAESAAKGIKGQMPDRTVQWENELKKEREAYLARKRGC